MQTEAVAVIRPAQMREETAAPTDPDSKMLAGGSCEEEADAATTEETGEDAEEQDEDEEEQEEDEKCLMLSQPHKMRVGQQAKGGSPGSAVSLTGMAFSASVEALLVTTKLTAAGGLQTYAVSQLQPAATASTGSRQHQPQHQHQQRATRHYQPAGLEHRGQLGLASCGADAPGQLVCAGAGAVWHGVFLLQSLAGAGSQPVLARCCGPPGDRLGQFNRPAGCAVDSGSAWVADQLNHRVQRLALPTLAPLAELRHPRLFRPSHLAVLADAHFGLRLLLVAHECGVLAFDLQLPQRQASQSSSSRDQQASAEPADTEAMEFARSRSPVRRWGGLCVHWGAVLLADQAANCIRVYRYRPPSAGSHGGTTIDAGFSLVQRLSLAPLGLCLPRHLASHLWLDLLYLAAHDTRDNGGEVCLLTAQMVRVQQQAAPDAAEIAG